MIGIGRPRWREVSGAPQRRRPLRSNHRPGKILLPSSKVMARICYFPFLNRNRGDKDLSLLSQNCSCGFDLLPAGRLVGAAGQKKKENPACMSSKNMLHEPVWDWHTMTATDQNTHVRTVPECVIIHFTCWYTYWKTCLCLQQPPVKKRENFSFHLCH